MKLDNRPQRGMWAPGGCYKPCLKCGFHYLGDKRSMMCADCAYAMQPYIPPTAEERIKQLEAVVNNPEALWTNWLRGTVKLPEGIGDVRQYQERIQKLEEAAKVTSEQIYLMAELHSRRTLDERKRVVELEDAIRKTLDENRHLADGEDCTLRDLKKALPSWN